MFKKTFFSILLLVSGAAFAQNTDSVNLVNAKWNSIRIAPKTKLLTHHFNQQNLFLANQNISIIEIKAKRNAPNFNLGYEVKELKTTSTYGKENNAIAAINGTFFDVKNGGSVDFIKVKGKEISPNILDKNGNRARHQQAAVVIKNGKLSIEKWDGTTKWEQSITAENVMNSGPLLIYQQTDERLDSTEFNKLRHPRSAVGIKPNGKVILLTVDGRHENSAGMSLFELTKVMRWLGCTSAINLDGGGSTTLWVDSPKAKGVVNYPSDNKKWDHEGERKVANVILLQQKQ